MFKNLVSVSLSVLAACATTPVVAPTPTPAAAPAPTAAAVSNPRSIECNAFPEHLNASFQRTENGAGKLAGNLAFNYESVVYAACTEGSASIVCDGTWRSGGDARDSSARLEISLVPDHGAFRGELARPGGAIQLGCLLSENDLPHS